MDKKSAERKRGLSTLKWFSCLLIIFGLISTLFNYYVANSLGIGQYQSLSNQLKESFGGLEDLLTETKGADDSSSAPEEGHSLVGLNCEKYGGPSTEAAQEMVYWSDIPSDNTHVSPFKRTEGPKQYLTFEPDEGGWNNIRMAMETVLAMAFAMGRTLVLPPEKPFYLLHKGKSHQGNTQRNKFSFSHFFHMESISNEHLGLDIITFDEFVEREVMTGNIKNSDGQVMFPPRNITDWDGFSGIRRKELHQWLRKIGYTAIWDPDKCMAVFPSSPDPNDIQTLVDIKESVGTFPTYEAYVGKPFPVNASTKDRMMENWAGRQKLCIYDQEMQSSQVVHFPTDFKLHARLLVHFYAFLFFQDWKQDLWMKRFVRDHVRYIDEIQCAAARVVESVRNRVSKRTQGLGNTFNTLHVRRGDFQYTVTRFEADQILKMIQRKFQDGDTVYIATDERDKSFFKPLRAHYDVVFLDDFLEDLGHEVNSNYFGMIDQLVASRGEIFFGCWFSTFTGYIMRLRGYHANRNKGPGYEQGIHNSWYYALEDRFDHIQTFYPVKQSYYAREFPASWRLIDTGV